MRKIKPNKQIYIVYLILFIIIVSITACQEKSEVRPISNLDKERISEETILSENRIDYDSDSKEETVIVKMIEGTYVEEKEPGPFMGWNYQGKFVIETKDDNQVKEHQLELNSLFENEPMIFNKEFELKFNDYNDDGNIDFTIGQYGTSNGYEYAILSIEPDGKIKKLTIKNTKLLFNSNKGYSIQLKKKKQATFENSYYNNIKGENIKDYYTWDGNEFIKTKK